MPTMSITLITLILAVPISYNHFNIPFADRYDITRQIDDIVTPWSRPVPILDNRADVWLQEQKDNASYFMTPDVLRSHGPCVPEPATVLLMGFGWLYLWGTQRR